MNWAPTDKISLIREGNIPNMERFLRDSSSYMVIKKQEWHDKAKKLPKLYHYLKDNYYENSST